MHERAVDEAPPTRRMGTSTLTVPGMCTSAVPVALLLDARKSETRAAVDGKSEPEMRRPTTSPPTMPPGDNEARRRRGERTGARNLLWMDGEIR